MKIEAVDLFCGIGGLTYGLRQADINVLAGLDNDGSCAFPYEENNGSKFILADISKFDFEKIKSLYSKKSIRVLVGCAPCQPFSTHSFKMKDRESDGRWNMIDHFLEAVKTVDPHILSMENVRGLAKTEIYQSFVNSLSSLGYKVSADVVYCPDYGIPQNRSRLVLLASKLGDMEIPAATHDRSNYQLVRDAIGCLPKLNAGECDGADPMHRAKKLSSINVRRIKQSKPSGSWRDWSSELLPDCYRKASGQTYVSVYGRMSWDAVSPTMTTQFTNYGSGRFGHPDQDRALTLREGALLQTFPREYNFGIPVCMTRTSRHIGNAVPPLLARAIGFTIREHVERCYE